MADYSRAIYPMFLWYVYSAFRSAETVFTLADFKATVRIGYLDIAGNGANTIAWLRRNVSKRDAALRAKHPDMVEPMHRFERQLRDRGVTPETTYLYMHGHTLMDCVVMIALSAVCEKLKQMSIAKINASKKEGVALRNELANYTNSLRSIRDVLLDNENYTSCPLYKRLRRDLDKYLVRTILAMKKKGDIPDDSVLAIARKLRAQEGQ